MYEKEAGLQYGFRIRLFYLRYASRGAVKRNVSENYANLINDIIKRLNFRDSFNDLNRFFTFFDFFVSSGK
ncbi:hypothetical protein BES34_016600 [Leptospira inadai serovar Lyme]|uniref:Uncharacterized protein n=1 Tax=Leptospira inadai serovar Lyme TaxID=293084 RepID=A0ABX4YFA7_9LEPT|nr:hypothetical protein BES34_016600 [Leptospira inadai serovar Lyme]